MRPLRMTNVNRASKIKRHAVCIGLQQAMADHDVHRDVPRRRAQYNALMTDTARTTSRLALVGTLLMLMLVSVSAYLRLSAVNVGCKPWPACYAEASQGPQSAERQHHPLARLAHRILASAAGVIVLLVAYADVTGRAGQRRRIGRAVLLVALTVALASLGRITPGATSVVVALGNLLGGAALTGLLWWAALDPPDLKGTVPGGHPAHPGFALVAGLAYATLTVAAIQFVLGALLSTTGAAAACATLLRCTEGTWTSADVLHLTHRLTALVLMVAAGCLAVALLRGSARARHCALALGLVVVLQAAAGVSMVVSGFSLWLALAHNFGGVLTLLAAVAATRV